MKAYWALPALLLACSTAGAQPQALRVCADPDNLPFSHEDGSGFENRIAALLAADLGLRLEYAWLPDRRGFVRKTLGSDLCDLIVGVPAGFERTLNTKPYYRSSYVLVAAAAQPPVRDFHDPRLRQWRIGVQLPGDDMAATPPGHALMQVGAIDNVTGFTVPGEEPAAARMVHAIERGELDAAFIWGPQAGYFAARAEPPLGLQRVPAPAQVATQRFEFGIAIGVRRGDAALRDRLDALLERRRPEILRILAAYGVPLVEGPQR